MLANTAQGGAGGDGGSGLAKNGVNGGNGGTAGNGGAAIGGGLAVYYNSQYNGYGVSTVTFSGSLASNVAHRRKCRQADRVGRLASLLAP